MIRSRYNTTGFTLIEMLVALALIVTIVSMVYGSYAATSRSLDVYNSRITCTERAHLVLRLMTRQIRGAYAPADAAQTAAPSAGDPSDRRPATAASATESSSPVFRADPLGARGEILCFATTNGLGAGPDMPSGLSLIRYRYDKTGGILSIGSERYTAGPPDRQNQRRWQPLLHDIEHLDMKFHDGRQWQNTWDFTKKNALPRAVKVDLTLLDEDGREHRFATTARIMQRAASSQQTTQRRSMNGRP